MSSTERHGNFEELEAAEPYPGIERRVVDADGATVSRYAFQPGARFPQHVHVQEQITIVQSGEVELNVDGTKTILQAGDWSVMPGGVPHGITAGPEGASILATVVPRRSSATELTVVE